MNMNDLWQNAKGIALRQQFQTEFAEKITAACTPTPPPKQKKLKKTHVVPPSIFNFLLNLQTPQKQVAAPFKQAAITSPIPRKPSKEKLDTNAVDATANADANISPLDTPPPAPMMLSPEETALNNAVNQWFNEQLAASTDKTAIMTSILDHEAQPPATAMVIELLPKFQFNDEQYKGLIKLLLHTGPQGVLMCLQALQRMQKEKGMFEAFNNVFLASGDFSQFMSPKGQDNLNYFTQLRGSKLIWWNALIAQHQPADGEAVDFNNLLEGYRYFLTELEKMGLQNIPSECPFKSPGNMKDSLKTALDILKQVNPADRMFQLMELDGLNFNADCAPAALRRDNFQWVSKEMRLVPGDQPSYAVDAPSYYAKVNNPMPLSAEEQNEVFYRYLGQHKPGSTRATYDELKKLIQDPKEAFTPAEQAKLLYMVVMSAWGEEPDRELTFFLNALHSANQPDLITTLVTRFDGIDADKIKLTQLTQIITTLSQLSYTAPDTMLSYLPRLLSFIPNNSDLLDILLKRHAAQKDNANESMRFTNLITLLTSDAPWFDTQEQQVPFMKILALLSGEVTGDEASQLSRTLLTLSPEHRTSILSRLSAINLAQSTNVASFTFTSVIGMLTKVAGTMPDEDIAALISAEWPDIKIGNKEDEPSTLTAEECNKEFMKTLPIIYMIEQLPFIGRQLAGIVAPMLENNLKGEAYFKKLDDDEATLKGYISLASGISPAFITDKLTSIGKADVAPMVISLLKTGSMRSFIPLIFLSRFNKQLDRAVKQLQTGQPTLDEFLTTCLAEDKISIPENTPYGSTIKQYDTQFQIVQTFTNILLALKNKDIDDYRECTALLSDPLTWKNLGLNNMGLLLQKLKAPVAPQLRSVLSNLQSIEIMPTEDKITALVNDLERLAENRDALGEQSYKQLLEKAVTHDLTQSTPFSLAKLIALKQGNKDGISAQQANELFNTILRIYKVLPDGNPTIIDDIIDKTVKIMDTHAKDMPNIVSFLTIELDRITTEAENRTVMQASADNKSAELNWWFLLSMWSTITAAFTLLLYMVTSFFNIFTPAYWQKPAATPETPKAEEPVAKTDADTLTELQTYCTSLDALNTGILEHPEAKANITGLFDFWPYPSLDALTTFFTGDKHAETLTKLKNELNDVTLQLQSNAAALADINKKIAHNHELTMAYQQLIQSQEQTDSQTLAAISLLAKDENDRRAQELTELTATKTTLANNRITLKTNRTNIETKLTTARKESLKHVQTCIASFDKDPLNQRAKNKALENQRTTDRVNDVVHGMADLLQSKAFSEEEQAALTRQFAYLNVVGTSAEFPLIVGTVRCENLATASRVELRELAKTLTTALRCEDPKPTPEADERLTLQLLAVMREAFYRSTGKFPYSTQMLSVLVSLNYPDNLMLQINTGEGKTTTTAMIAAIQCLRGGSLDERENKARTQIVCTGNPTLVEQGYAETHHYFNDFLGIPSSVITQVGADAQRMDPASNTLSANGITYTTIQALSFYKQREKYDGRSFTHDKEGNALNIDSIFDECDSAFLDDYTQLSLVAPKAGNELLTVNPEAWIYELVDEYTEQDDTKGLTLREFIETHPDTTTAQRLQLLSIPDSKLDTWEDAALEVLDYKEGIDYVILQEGKRTINGIEKSISMVTPLNRSGAPQRGSTFPNYRHEVLQGKMQRQARIKQENATFPIDPEVTIVDQESSKSLIDGLKKKGRILGLSGTLGSTDELQELASAHDVHALKIPPHKKNRRDTSMPALVGNSLQKQNDYLKKLINEGSEQPLLVACKTILEVESLYRTLNKRYPGRVQLITGKEPESEITQIKNRAGLNGMITIFTPLMGRGVDWQTKYPNGFHLHQRFIDAQRETEQVIGRVARNGELGKYSASYVVEGVSFEYGFNYFGVDTATALEKIKEQQKKITQDAARVRHYIQAFDAIQQVVLQQFDICKNTILKPLEGTPDEASVNALSDMRTNLIDTLSTMWNNNLPQDAEHPNPYLNDPKVLNDALKHFEEKMIPELWKKTHSTLLEVDNKTTQPHGLNSSLEYLADIKPALAGRKLTVKQEKNRTKLASLHTHQRLKSALDPALAMLHYSDKTTLSPEEKVRWESVSDATQLTDLITDFNQVIGNKHADAIHCDASAPTIEKLNAIILAISTSWSALSLKQQYQLYSTVAQLIEYTKKPEVTEKLTASQRRNITRLERYILPRLQEVTLDELQKQLAWANPKTRTAEYVIERPNVQQAADAIYALINDPEVLTDTLKLLRLYECLYKHQLLLKDALPLYIPWGHADIRDVISNTLHHIHEIQQITSIDESSFKTAREAASTQAYFQQFNDKVEEISRAYPDDKTWESIANHISSIQHNYQRRSVFHELFHYLQAVEKTSNPQLTPSNSLHYFFNHTKYSPIPELLNALNMDKIKMDEKDPEWSKDETYLAAKAAEMLNLLNTDTTANLNIKSLSITSKYSGIGEYFELSITDTQNPEYFDRDDVIRYASNTQKLNQDKIQLKANRTSITQKIEHYEVALNKLDELTPTNPDNYHIDSDTTLPDDVQADIRHLNRSLIDWHQEQAQTWSSGVLSAVNTFSRYMPNVLGSTTTTITNYVTNPYTPDIIEQIAALKDKIRSLKDIASERNRLLQKNICFLDKAIAKEQHINDKVIIKKFASIDDILKYEDTLKERLKANPEAEIAPRRDGPDAG